MYLLIIFQKNFLRTPPYERFWNQIIRFHGRVLRLEYTNEPSKKNHNNYYYNNNRNMDENNYQNNSDNTLNVSTFLGESLEMGIFLDKDTFVSEWKSAEQVKFFVDYQRLEIRITFGFGSFSFKLAIQFKDI